MELQKLKSRRTGNRSAVTRLLRKFADAKESSEFDREELLATYENLQQKKKLLDTLNEQIENASETEDKETKIVDTDEYTTNFVTKLRHFKIFIDKTSQPISNQPSHSSYQVLNVDSPPFIPTSSPEIAQTSYAAPSLPQSNDAARILTETSQIATSIPTSSYTVPSAISSNHRLPKLTLPTFNGNILEWPSFWDSYESAVHYNPTLTDVQKFNYLKAQLENEAAQTIAGFSLTNANYAEAVNVLIERFGQTHKITQAHLQALLDITPPRNDLISLRMFYDKMESLVRGLESLGQTQDSYGNLLVPIIINKLPGEIRKHLAREHGTTNWLLRDLRKSILKEIQIMEAGQVSQTESDISTSTFFAGAKSQRKHNASTRNANHHLSAKPCIFCKDIHSPANCPKIRDLDKRLAIVKQNHLCFNCLGKHHIKECKSKGSCRNCSKRHHTSLCSEVKHTADPDKRSNSDTNNPLNSCNKNETTPSTSTIVNLVKDTEIQEDSTILHSSAQFHSNVLLKTAVAPVWSDRHCTDTNILFDEGAQRSFVTESLARKLNLQREGADNIQLSSFGETNANARRLDKATVYVETETGHKIPIQVLIVPMIATPLQNHIRYIDRNNNYLKGLKLAHPVTQQDTFEISLLIGADFYWEIIEDKVVRGNGPIAVKSKLGYLLSGPLHSEKSKHSTTSSIFNVLISRKTEEHDLEAFWKLEAIGIESPEVHEKENDYIRNYQVSSIEFRDHKYYAKLPWKTDHDELPLNYAVTKKRTESVIRRLRQEPNMLKKYSDIITDQENRGFIERVYETEPIPNKIHYIPHHPVKKDSSTTPIRIVYDCSCRISPNHPSLNDCLMNTPPILNDLTKILIRFRLNRYAITTDIEKAFLHVGLHEDDRDVTRFLWLSNPSDPDSHLIEYRFKAVLFGATCSPFILNATLLKHLQQTNNTTRKLLERDLYVDNILSSLNTEDDAIVYFKEARKLMNKAGFNLRSWTSNSEKVRTLAATENVLDTDEETKILGMRWNSVTDELFYPKREILNSSEIVTKREILKHSSRIYDPLGLLSPVTIRNKILLQDIWKRGFDWDQKVDEDIRISWMDLAKDVEQVTHEVFNRYLFSKTSCNSTGNNLHVFVDASTKAYGAVAYLCNGSDSTLVMAKTRVAPLKELTLPQLELMAAVIGARLVNHLKSTLECSSITLWSDSQIVLHWLKSTKTLKRFITNRVNEINDLTYSHIWKYCPTDCNPADLLTRGITSEKYKESTLWKKGPNWLTDTSKFPNTTIVSDASLSVLINEQENSQATRDISTDKNENQPGLHVIMDLNRYGSYKRLLRITAYVQRFVSRCRKQHNSRQTGLLKPPEIQKSAELWIKHCQETSFSEEYKALKSKTTTNLPRIRQLRFFLDDNNLMRCQGRIHNAPISEFAKFPYILPSNHASLNSS
ncbi:uncharacterized protein [Mytilus edulis]|uniref:uncharacterized protein n=1 Tax=Mytilus edulis TaxID=6550 RepID=UPI0039EEA9BB